jgi:hypothetical protein
LGSDGKQGNQLSQASALRQVNFEISAKAMRGSMTPQAYIQKLIIRQNSPAFAFGRTNRDD